MYFAFGINLCKLALESCGEEHLMSEQVYIALGVGYSLKYSPRVDNIYMYHFSVQSMMRESTYAS